jgi:hypothetical protein
MRCDYKIRIREGFFHPWLQLVDFQPQAHTDFCGGSGYTLMNK